MSEVNLGYAMSLPPEKAIAYFESKNIALAFNYTEIEEEAQACAFVVSGILKMDIVADIHQALLDAISQGQSQATFTNNVLPELQNKGWIGKGLKADEDGVLEGKQLLPYRLDNIFRTNVQSAYMAGSYQQQMENVKFRPYWQYVAVMDSRTRPAHAALNGETFRYDSPAWGAIYPPNGYRCRCRVRTFSKKEIERKNITVTDAKDKMKVVQQPWGRDGTTRPVLAFHDPATGKNLTPDPGFGHNAGRSYLATLGQQLLEKATTTPANIASLALNETLSNQRLRSEIAQELGEWQQRISDYPAMATDRRYVGGIAPDVLSSVNKDRSTPLASVSIVLLGEQIASASDWSGLPDLLYNPTVLVWDALNSTLFYANEDSGQVVSVNVASGQPTVSGRRKLNKSVLSHLPVLTGGWRD